MNYLITEPIIAGGIKQHKTRSRIVALGPKDPVPDGAVKTDEAPRDWQADEPKESE